MKDLARTPNVTHDGLAGRRNRLLASYLFNRKRGTTTIRRMISDDIYRFDELGARSYATELREVLTRFESAVGADL
jgi:hypothetical protein